VVLRADHNVTDLQLEKKNFKAASGTNGMGSDMHGARGETMELRVPCGTLVERLGLPSPSRTSRMEPPDAPRTTLAELLTDGDSILVARGGRGGRGNASFRQGLQQHARIAEDGGAGEAATLLLSLKLIADVGLVGFPNAGKSSLLRALSNAVPKVAPYPFTTLHPHLGRVRASAHAEFTLADIPGLVDGAHANRGLGHSFLRHIERTSLLCYVLDLESEQPAISQLTKLQRELELYLPGLGQRPCLLVANKADVEGAPAKLRVLRSAVARLRAEGELSGLIGGDGGAGAGCGVGKGEGEGEGKGEGEGRSGSAIKSEGIGEGEGGGEGRSGSAIKSGVDGTSERRGEHMHAGRGDVTAERQTKRRRSHDDHSAELLEGTAVATLRELQQSCPPDSAAIGVRDVVDAMCTGRALELALVGLFNSVHSAPGRNTF
jgi:GTP-binding protein